MDGARLCGKRCSDEWSQVKLRHGSHDGWLGGRKPFLERSFQFTKIGFPRADRIRVNGMGENAPQIEDLLWI